MILHLEKLKTEVRQDSKDLENAIRKLEENATEKLNLEAQIKNYENVLAETVRHYFYFSLSNFISLSMLRHAIGLILLKTFL